MIGRLGRGLLVDTRPLRTSPEFRRLWLGSTLSAVGSQLTTFAVALQAFRLTHSSLAVGGVGLATAIPSICVGLYGGVLVDRFERRRLVLLTSSGLALVSVAFAVQAFAGVGRLPVLYVLAGAAGALSAVDAPARRTFTPRLLPARLLPAGVALFMVTVHLSLLAGPVVAGLLAGAGGLRLCYLVDVVSFTATLYSVWRLPAMHPGESHSGDGRPGRSGATRSTATVRAGLGFLRRSPLVAAALLVDVDATVLAMPIALFPAINADRFGGSPRILGLFTAALAVGGLAGAGLSGPVGRAQRQGRLLLCAAATWGIALAGFGLVTGLAATLACLAFAGVADVVSVVTRSTIVQTATPDEFRGRVSAAEYVVGTAMPQVGNFRGGAIAAVAGPSASAVIGGLTSTAGITVIALLAPVLRRQVATHGAPEN